jgi:hypothetical protein
MDPVSARLAGLLRAATPCPISSGTPPEVVQIRAALGGPRLASDSSRPSPAPAAPKPEPEPPKHAPPKRTNEDIFREINEARRARGEIRGSANEGPKRGVGPGPGHQGAFPAWPGMGGFGRMPGMAVPGFGGMPGLGGAHGMAGPGGGEDVEDGDEDEDALQRGRGGRQGHRGGAFRGTGRRLGDDPASPPPPNGTD